VFGGHCNFAAEEVTRNYQLPPHSWIRIAASYHMFDNWVGETGYLKLDDKVVWSQHGESKTHGVHVCGGESADKLNLPIYVTQPHSARNMTLSFGSTLPADPCNASFAIDNVVVYSRTK
jgi:hypothetical protein